MFSVGLIAVLVSLVLAMVRAIMGPSMFDRVLAANSTATLAVLSLSLLGFVTGRPDFLDIAILYTLLNLVGTIAVLKYFHPGES
ncbi:MAG: monovalent cation/H+ antiporter complex subunit F [Alphaproteobacteria bacterium]|nr:monovalent cation/H+ antiporter complex subunit F [Alphaproteobacteria bacterium]|tara:strand:+ start:502 stop:753 length:252 start_codon:yes stop_codon:yes gene_type:complete